MNKVKNKELLSLEEELAGEGGKVEILSQRLSAFTKKNVHLAIAGFHFGVPVFIMSKTGQPVNDSYLLDEESRTKVYKALLELKNK